MAKAHTFLRFVRADVTRVYKVRAAYARRVVALLERAGWDMTTLEIAETEPCFITAEERSSADTAFATE